MSKVIVRVMGVFGAFALMAGTAFAQAPGSAPFECDGGYDEDCGTPNTSGGGGCGCGGGSILINNTDVGDTYQYSDDYDGDGFDDTVDVCPFNFDPDQANDDGDLYGNACDNCLTAQNDDQLNLDGDAFGDICDADLDGDGLDNAVDNCQFIPNRIAEGAAAQADLDGDGIGDACDTDIDGDGLDNLADACPMDADINASGDACFVDTDKDSIGDFDALTPDNCPTIANADQRDIDGDGIGDACDSDMDNDGIANQIDNCVGSPNADQVDADRDGLGNGCDDNYCYVVFGDAANCLDPAAPLQVYSPPLQGNTGDDIRLRLFANRQSQALRYTWTVVSAPAGSRALLENANGMVSYSDPFEYRYLKNKVAVLRPDVAGDYVIRLQATSVWEDRVTNELNASAATEVTVSVTGPTVDVTPGGGDGGCNSSAPAGGLLFGLMMLAGFAIIRRREVA